LAASVPDTFTTVLGRRPDQVWLALRLTRFARLLPQLLSQKQLPLVRADLRYTNGFALSWPSPTAARAVAPQSQGTT